MTAPAPRKRGRPQAVEPTVILRARVKPALHAYFIERGGAVWIRRVIEDAMLREKGELPTA